MEDSNAARIVGNYAGDARREAGKSLSGDFKRMQTGKPIGPGAGPRGGGHKGVSLLKP
ncbi:MAG: hypothetical protein WAM85_01835 [Terracidiphilus sp.]